MVIYISETTTDHINTNMVRHSSIKSKYVAVVDEIFVETYHILAWRSFLTDMWLVVKDTHAIVLASAIKHYEMYS